MKIVENMLTCGLCLKPNLMTDGFQCYITAILMFVDAIICSKRIKSTHMENEGKILFKSLEMILNT